MPSQMDAVAASKVAAGVLSFVQLGTELRLSLEKSPDSQPEQPVDTALVLEQLGGLQDVLSDVTKAPNAWTAERVSGASSALRELAGSCLEDVRLLLGELEKVAKSSGGQAQSEAAGNSGLRKDSPVLSRIRRDRMDHLSEAVTAYISPIIRHV